ncbi:uncharacterized protein C3orf62 homolog [Rhinichthys klamathensis goyatoka]|uniref:uncharacterized protein C3orf62 homolog n=1 Tax=Rhinichthys klamathensis goyatoka TaxID=3034132 RepID=UPI0024B5AF9B|nr:uncharacterized protein C3orf62 homolog [Rhinichthys klamathensis goyatoka]
MCFRCVYCLSVINAAVVPIIMYNYRPFSINRKEDFLCCTRSVLRDLHGLLDIQTLEDLVAKLEFENELNRVCSRSLQSKNPESSLHQREGANSGMEEESTDRWVHDSNEEYSFLLDTILEIERDSDFTADCDDSSLELDLQLSP